MTIRKWFLRRFLILCMSSGIGAHTLMHAMQPHITPEGLRADPLSGMVHLIDQLTQLNQLSDKLHTVGNKLIDKTYKSAMSVIVASGVMVLGAYTAYRGMRTLFSAGISLRKRMCVGLGLIGIGLMGIGASPFIGMKMGDFWNNIKITR